MGRMIKNAKDADERVLVDRLWELRREREKNEQEASEIKALLRIGRHSGNEHGATVYSVKSHQVRRTTFWREGYRAVRVRRRA